MWVSETHCTLSIPHWPDPQVPSNGCWSVLVRTPWAGRCHSGSTSSVRCPGSFKFKTSSARLGWLLRPEPCYPLELRGCFAGFLILLLSTSLVIGKPRAEVRGRFQIPGSSAPNDLFPSLTEPLSDFIRPSVCLLVPALGSLCSVLPSLGHMLLGEECAHGALDSRPDARCKGWMEH